jgi:uncharacterized protein (TIGR03083 family)
MTGKVTESRRLSGVAVMLSVMPHPLPTPDYFLACLRSDAARLAEVARRGLDAAVPSCPGWTVRDLLEHTAVVYLHKVEAMRSGAQPDPWPPDLSGRDVAELYDEATAGLIAELEQRGPDAPTWTWWKPDQSTGFWFRRMAHETAVHRVDAELAHDVVTPIDARLATDGIDEILRVMLAGADWEQYPSDHPVDAAVRITSGGRSWTVTMARTDAAVSETNEPHEDHDEPGESPVAAEVFGDPDDVLLWLWRRRDDEAVGFAGDRAVTTAFRARLAETTT